MQPEPEPMYSVALRPTQVKPVLEKACVRGARAAGLVGPRGVFFGCLSLTPIILVAIALGRLSPM